MPILLLWNETVAGAIPQFDRWFSSFERSNFLIDRWLKKRLSEAKKMDTLTHRFPIFHFRDGAVTALVTRLQFGALLSGPVSGVGAHMERALDRWNVVRRTSNAIRETQLLPEIFRIFEEISGGVLASIDRFRTPTAETFDPSRRRIEDLPGLLVMTYRGVARSQTQIVRAAGYVRDAFFPGSEDTEGTSPGSATSTASETTAASALPLHYTLDGILRYITSGLLVIPALGGLLGTVGSDLLLHIRHVVLDLFSGIERRAFDLRRQILEVFVTDLHDYARKGLLFILTAREIALSYIRLYSMVGIDYLRGVVAGVGVFASQMEEFWVGFTNVVHKVVGFGNAVLSIDMGPVLHGGFEAIADAIEAIDTHLYAIGDSPEEYTAPAEFPVTLGEMVLNQGAGARANRELTRAVELLRSAWTGADPIGAALNAGIIHKATGYHIPNLIGALLLLTQDTARGPFGSVGALRLPRSGAPTQPSLSFDASTVPNLATEILTPLREGVSGMVHTAITGVAQGIEGIVSATMTTLDNTSSAFDEAARRASQMGSLRLLTRMTSNTDALMGSLFGSQVTESPDTGLDPVSGTYAEWLIQGGFDTIGAASAGFIGMVLDEWMVHLQQNSDTPVEVTATSPRILLERARLGRVRTPEIRVTARGEYPSRSLAIRIADGFQDAVQEAYSSGQFRFDALLASAPSP